MESSSAHTAPVTIKELTEALRDCRNRFHKCITAPRGKAAGMDEWVADAACQQYDEIIRRAEASNG